MKPTLLLLLIVLRTVAHAQSAFPEIEGGDTTNITGKRGFELFFSQYLAFSNASGINARLLENDYPQLGGMQVFWGGGVQYRLNRWLLGMELTHTINPYGPRVNETAVARRNAYAVQLQIYYAVYQRDVLRVYPFLGAGGMETQLFLKRNSADLYLNNILRQPGNAVWLTHFQGFINVGIGFDAVLNRVGDSPLAKIQLGYRAGDRSEWFSDYAEIRNAPADRLSNFYVQISLGYATNWKSKRQQAGW